MPRKKRPIEAELTQLREHLTAWREAHPPRSRLPEEFWKEAVTHARRYGLHRTSRALPVDYKKLKDRLAASGAPAKFVEVAVAAPATAITECTLVLEASQGKLRLELKAMPVEDIARLVRALSA